MRICYKKLWKMLIDKDMKKKDLQAISGVSWTSVTKLSKGEPVSMEVLMKVCNSLGCNIGDIIDFVSDESTEASTLAGINSRKISNQSHTR
jgi:DNA-binding Xre family transcriptional regulator